MNWKPFDQAIEGVENALQTVEANHYSLPKGRIALRKALSKHYSPHFARDLDPDKEIGIYSGANVAILCESPVSNTESCSLIAMISLPHRIHQPR